MFEKAFINRIGITQKIALVNIVLLANAFIWYFYAFSLLEAAIDDAGFSNIHIVLLAINFLGTAVSSLISATLIERIKQRVRFLQFWTIGGFFVSLIPLFIGVAPLVTMVLLAAGIGIYFGVGMPICFSYFAATTEASNRSRLGGISFFLIFLGFAVISSIGTSDIAQNAMLLAAWRVAGFVVLLALKPSENQIKDKAKVSYSYVVRDRSFLLYFVPWCMFLLVNFLIGPVNDKFFSNELVQAAGNLENIIAGICAIVGGFFADSMGRKRLAVGGFALLGIGYGVLVFTGDVGYWFYALADGVAWGLFYTVFLITLWGDLSQGQSTEKYYALGSLPFLLSNIVRLTIGTYVASIIKTADTVFTFASFLLFLAVLPLVYAPETLPEKVMKDRDLRSYVEKAKKKMLVEIEKEPFSLKKDAEKFAAECQVNIDQPNQDEQNDVVEVVLPAEECSEEDEEAKRLAEKYY